MQLFNVWCSIYIISWLSENNFFSHSKSRDMIQNEVEKQEMVDFFLSAWHVLYNLMAHNVKWREKSSELKVNEQTNAE